MYLFDTDIITHPLKPRPVQQVVARLSAVPAGQRHIATITLGEIVFGAQRSDRPSHHLQRLEQLILPRVTLLPFDEAAARQYGIIRAELQRKGIPLATTDLQIAGVALANGLILVTGNTRHFERVPGLKIENWLQVP